MKVGLLLEGGGMRGMYTSGILDIMLDYNVQINDIVGVSAGALFGTNFISKQRGRAIRYNQKYITDKRYMGFYSWLTTGNFVNKDFTYYELPMALDVFDNEAFKNSSINLFSVVTNIRTGKPEYFKISDVFEQMELLRATSALPFMSKPIEWDGELYLDGGIADSIPIDFVMEKQYDKVIVVLTQPKNYYKKPSHPKINALKYKKYPNLVEALNRRYQIYNASIKRINDLEAEGKIFVIRPSEAIKIKRLEKNPDELGRVYQLGIQDGTEQISELMNYLNA